MSDKVYTKTVEGFGTFRTDQNPPKIRKTYKLNAILFFSFSIFFGIFMTVCGVYCDLPEMVLVGPVAFVFFGLFGYFTGIRQMKKLGEAYAAFLDEVEQLKKKEAEKERKFKEQHPHYEEEKFYLECKKNKIDNVSDKANIARLELIAKKLNLTQKVNELINMYKIGQEDVESAKKASKIEKKKREEQKLHKESKKYISCVGREKKIKMLSDEMEPFSKKLVECKAKLDAIDNGTFNLYKAGEGKESDWALWGGIAEGIGGPAAGIATAIDIQNKNAQIRANNDALLKTSATLAVSLKTQVYEEERRAESEIEYYKKQIEKTEMKLIDNSSPKELLNQLNPTATLHISETGAVKITVKTSGTPKLKIYDSVPAVVDGTIKINILKDGVKMGYAYATLPVDGSESECTIETICLSPKESATQYTVSFEPYKLWAIEK